MLIGARLLSMNSSDLSGSRRSAASSAKRGRNKGNNRKRSFGSVPADDVFRNYMSRKIELQRKQFGLVLPPPPRDKKAGKTPKSSIPVPKFSNCFQQPQPPKPEQIDVEVRRKENILSSNSQVLSVSEVLNQLKERHTDKNLEIDGGKSCKVPKKTQQYGGTKLEITNDANSRAKVQAATYETPTKERQSVQNLNSKSDSILSVLDSLQKRHGEYSSSKKKFPATPTSQGRKNRKKRKRNEETPSTVFELLDSLEKRKPKNHKLLKKKQIHPSSNFESSSSAEKGRGSPRCDTRSVLESLDVDKCNEKGKKSMAIANADKDILHRHTGADYSSSVDLTFDSPLTLRGPTDVVDSQMNNGLGHEHSPLIFREEKRSMVETPIHSPHRLLLAQLTQPSPIVDMSPVSAAESVPHHLSPNVSLSRHINRPDLFFFGVVIIVNGHTSPDAMTLMRLMHKHGGDLEKYETSRVTHIIAERLSTAKANIYKRQKKPTPVCRPEWITDCVKAEKLLPFADYLVEDVRDGDVFGTKSVKTFFKVIESESDSPREPNKKENLLLHHELSSEEHQLRSESEGMKTNENLIERQATTSRYITSLGGKNESESESATSKKRQSETQCDNFKRERNFITSGGANAINADTCESLQQHSSPTKTNYKLNGQVRTVGNDPNFLESYFSNSRLSYIGSFKQRIKPSAGSRSLKSQSRAVGERFVLLIDMDCFFASVALRKYPQYRNHPVAVGHVGVTDVTEENNRNVSRMQAKNSSSELSTCNYIARMYGLKKGMFLGDALKLCPDLIVLPYDFNGFEEVAGIVTDQLYLFAEQYHGCVEQVSCDEAYVEIYLGQEDCPNEDIYDFVRSLAERVRSEIFNKTECTASIGVGPNKLLAKLAADKVKPDACHVVRDWRALLNGLSLRDIPGVGRKYQKKLEPHSLCIVNDVWDLGEEAEEILGGIIGKGNAKKIGQFCHGKDGRPVMPALRKSIGAECNYGVRFDGPYGVDYMIRGLAKEVQRRMTCSGVRGSKLTLKVMKSKDTLKIPGKFLGHGPCDNFSKSADLPLTRDSDSITLVGCKLYERMNIDKHSIRGMGLVVSSLQHDDSKESFSSMPLKLSAWLKKGISESTTSDNLANGEACTSREALSPQRSLRGDQYDEKKVTFALEEETLCVDNHAGAFLRSPIRHNNTDSVPFLPALSRMDQKSSSRVEHVSRAGMKPLEAGVIPAADKSDKKVTTQEGFKRSENQQVQIIELSQESSPGSREAFVVPPMSQIDIDEVMELPPPICDHILKRLEARHEVIQEKEIIHIESDQPPPDHQEMNTSAPKLIKKRKINDKAIPIVGQASVRRMLKLASVKSGIESAGCEGTNIRLSQLDCLPMEIQLQIANGDNIEITKKISGTDVDNNMHPQSTNPSQNLTVITDEGPALNQDPEDGCAFEYYNVSSTNFFQENVKPLQDYILSNPNPNNDELGTVKEFLFLCIQEGRLNDVVILLRAIKGLQNGWDGATYNKLRESVLQEIHSSSGSKLDLAWLEL